MNPVTHMDKIEQLRAYGREYRRTHRKEIRDNRRAYYASPEGHTAIRSAIAKYQGTEKGKANHAKAMKKYRARLAGKGDV
jgi:hypothetical protein